jgi:cell filamentation protein
LEQSTTGAALITSLLTPALTDKINDRAVFMKGVDYSYYYEQEEEISEGGRGDEI